jgi:hypothetical protein
MPKAWEAVLVVRIVRKERVMTKMPARRDSGEFPHNRQSR